MAEASVLVTGISQRSLQGRWKSVPRAAGANRLCRVLRGSLAPFGMEKFDDLLTVADVGAESDVTA